MVQFASGDQFLQLHRGFVQMKSLWLVHHRDASPDQMVRQMLGKPLVEPDFPNAVFLARVKHVLFDHVVVRDAAGCDGHQS